MKGTKVVVGVFSYMDDMLNACRRVKEAGFEFKTYSPVPVLEASYLADDSRSDVRFITGTGALTGITFGFSLAILCALDWPLRTSAKDVISIPAFVPIGYECTILFGGLATLLAVLHFCRLPFISRKVGYDPRFSGDKFGVVVGCDSDQIEDISKKLRDSGAEEVEVQDGL